MLLGLGRHQVSLKKNTFVGRIFLSQKRQDYFYFYAVLVFLNTYLRLFLYPNFVRPYIFGRYQKTLETVG